MDGTIGQPDADVMSGGSVTVQGGFSALLFALEVANAPTLFLSPAAPGFAAIAWNPFQPGFLMQVTDSMIPPAWTNTLSAFTNPVVVPATLTTRFYPLHQS